MTPGREVTFTVQVRGEREGWETIGHMTAADGPGQRVEITLAAEGPKMSVILPSQSTTTDRVHSGSTEDPAEDPAADAWR